VEKPLNVTQTPPQINLGLYVFSLWYYQTWSHYCDHIDRY
jgi:hypothetical protein